MKKSKGSLIMQLNVPMEMTFDDLVKRMKLAGFDVTIDLKNLHEDGKDEPATEV